MLTNSSFFLGSYLSYLLGSVKSLSPVSFPSSLINDFSQISSVLCAESLQSCLTLCNSMDCSPPGSSVHGILQARIQEWITLLEGILPTICLNQLYSNWMASPTQWTWIWVSSGSWWWTGKPGILQSMESSRRVRYDWAAELNWTELILQMYLHIIGV